MVDFRKEIEMADKSMPKFLSTKRGKVKVISQMPREPKESKEKPQRRYGNVWLNTQITPETKAKIKLLAQAWNCKMPEVLERVFRAYSVKVSGPGL